MGVVDLLGDQDEDDNGVDDALDDVLDDVVEDDVDIPQPGRGTMSVMPIRRPVIPAVETAGSTLHRQARRRSFRPLVLGHQS